MYNNIIKPFILDSGASFCGVSYQEDTPFEGLNYAITFGIKLSDAIIDQIDEKAPTKTYFHHYRAVNTLLDSIALQTIIKIQKSGYNAANIPASQSISEYKGLFSHKKAAVDSGLGWIGKNALFISYEFGPCVRLCTVFTDMELPVSKHDYKDECGDCLICSKMCPSEAISGQAWHKEINFLEFFDAQKCSEYMKNNFKDIGRGAVCGICMRYCPKRALTKKQ
ncbi:MAG: epoxyqueuosine reductase [Bacillota bacterium]|nr:epoxyqueuosine reductase [Bacillota bacterium]